MGCGAEQDLHRIGVEDHPAGFHLPSGRGSAERLAGYDFQMHHR